MQCRILAVIYVNTPSCDWQATMVNLKTEILWTRGVSKAAQLRAVFFGLKKRSRTRNALKTETDR